MPNMCIIYRMRNDCLCWLFLVTIASIRDWFPQVTKLPFCVGIELDRCTAPSTVFSQPYGKKRSFGGPFYGFKSKRLFRMNLMHWNTDNIPHVLIFIAYVTWVGKWHHSTFFLKFVSCVIIWYKNVPVGTSMESSKGEPMLWKFALYFN